MQKIGITLKSGNISQTTCSIYRVFIKYCVFPCNVVDFLNSASSAAALVFYLPGVCTHTDTEGNQRKARVRNILKSSWKNTIFNEHPVGNVFTPYIACEFLNRQNLPILSFNLILVLE